ncbi:MAG: hypothetical protein WCD79_11085 [Chthoniobacteraceae bacterium]
MRILIFIAMGGLLCLPAFAGDADKPAASPAPMKLEEWERILKGFKGELKMLQAVPVVSGAADFKKVRRAMFAKYLQLYVRVSDAEKKHNDMGPYPVSWDNPFDAGEPLDHGPDKRGWGEYAIWDASTMEMEERAAREKEKGRSKVNGGQFEFEVRLHKFKEEAGEAMAGYCGAAFDLFEDNDERDAIIAENVADLGIRRTLEERLDWLKAKMGRVGK